MLVSVFFLSLPKFTLTGSTESPKGKGETSGPKQQLFWASTCELKYGVYGFFGFFSPVRKNMDPKMSF